MNANSDPEFTPWLSLSTETGTHSAKCAAALSVEMAQVQFLDHLLTCYVQRQVPRCSCPDSAENRGIAVVTVPTVVLTSLHHAATSSAVLATRTVEGPQIQSSTGCS